MKRGQRMEDEGEERKIPGVKKHLKILELQFQLCSVPQQRASSTGIISWEDKQQEGKGDPTPSPPQGQQDHQIAVYYFKRPMNIFNIIV